MRVLSCDLQKHLNETDVASLQAAVAEKKKYLQQLQQQLEASHSSLGGRAGALDGDDEGSIEEIIVEEVVEYVDNSDEEGSYTEFLDDGEEEAVIVEETPRRAPSPPPTARGRSRSVGRLRGNDSWIKRDASRLYSMSRFQTGAQPTLTDLKKPSSHRKLMASSSHHSKSESHLTEGEGEAPRPGAAAAAEPTPSAADTDDEKSFCDEDEVQQKVQEAPPPVPVVVSSPITPPRRRGHSVGRIMTRGDSWIKRDASQLYNMARFQTSSAQPSLSDLKKSSSHRRLLQQQAAAEQDHSNSTAAEEFATERTPAPAATDQHTESTTEAVRGRPAERAVTTTPPRVSELVSVPGGPLVQLPPPPSAELVPVSDGPPVKLPAPPSAELVPVPGGPPVQLPPPPSAEKPKRVPRESSNRPAANAAARKLPMEMVVLVPGAQEPVEIPGPPSAKRERPSQSRVSAQQEDAAPLTAEEQAKASPPQQEEEPASRATFESPNRRVKPTVQSRYAGATAAAGVPSMFAVPAIARTSKAPSWGSQPVQAPLPAEQPRPPQHENPVSTTPAKGPVVIGSPEAHAEEAAALGSPATPVAKDDNLEVGTHANAVTRDVALDQSAHSQKSTSSAKKRHHVLKMLGESFKVRLRKKKASADSDTESVGGGDDNRSIGSATSARSGTSDKSADGAMRKKSRKPTQKQLQSQRNTLKSLGSSIKKLVRSPSKMKLASKQQAEADAQPQPQTPTTPHKVRLVRRRPSGKGLAPPIVSASPTEASRSPVVEPNVAAPKATTEAMAKADTVVCPLAMKTSPPPSVVAVDHKPIEWEKPSWAKQTVLKQTDRGAAVKSGANIARPITMINKSPKSIEQMGGVAVYGNH